MPDDTKILLRATGVVAGYGRKRVLDGVDVDVAHGEVVAIIGHNGAGKSTLLKVLFGLLPAWKGTFEFDGMAISELSPRRLLSLGVAFVPQGNRVFTDMSVRENIEVGWEEPDAQAALPMRIDRACALFPPLRERLTQRAGTLSGGEKQMLALAMSLNPAPQLLLLDEPSLGLAPKLVHESLHNIGQIAQNARVGILIVEQKVREVLRIARRVYVLRNGRVSYTGPADVLQSDRKLREVYL